MRCGSILREGHREGSGRHFWGKACRQAAVGDLAQVNHLNEEGKLKEGDE